MARSTRSGRSCAKRGASLVRSIAHGRLSSAGWSRARSTLRYCLECLLTTRTLVTVIDDDESVRESLPDLLAEFGFDVRAFSSAEAFLASDCVAATRCLIVDIAMPAMSGLDLQKQLKARLLAVPIVFITAQADDTVRRRVMVLGAIACLSKPFSDTALLAAVNAALGYG